MRYVPLEEASKQLDRLVKAAAAGEAITISWRGAEQAVLLSGEEYRRLLRLEEEVACARFKEALEAIGVEVEQAGLAPEVVEEAVGAVRRHAGMQ